MLSGSRVLVRSETITIYRDPSTIYVDRGAVEGRSQVLSALADG
jgi:hypothetical protein